LNQEIDTETDADKKPIQESKPTTDANGRPTNPLLGVLCMLGSALSYSMVSCCLKVLYARSPITSFEAMYWKSMPMLFYEWIFLRLVKGDYLKVPKEQRTTLFFRAFTGFLGLAGYFTSI